MSMHARTAEHHIAEIGAGRQGMVTAELASASGVPWSVLDHHCRAGRLLRVGRGVYRLRDHPWTWQTQVRAALDLAGPKAVVGFRSAARLHDFYAYAGADAVEVIAPRGQDHRIVVGRLIESRHLPPAHVVTMGGFRVTTVARTCFDLAGDPDPALRSRAGRTVHEQRMARVVNDALARRGLTFAAEVAVLLAHGKRGRSGTRLVRELLRRFGPQYTPTTSEAESLYVELVESTDLPVPERQVALSDKWGWVGTVDFFYRPLRLVVEVDSMWHDGPLEKVADTERDERLRGAGYGVLRVQYGELMLEPATFLRRLQATIDELAAAT